MLLAIAVAIAFVLLTREYPCTVSSARADAASPAGLFQSLRISGSGFADTSSEGPHRTMVPRTSAHATLTGPGRTVSLRVRDAAMRVAYDGPDGERVRTLDAMTEDDALQWMRAAGVATDRPEARDEANAVMNLIRAVVIGGVQPPTGLARATMICERYEIPRPGAIAWLSAIVAIAWALLLWDLRRWRAGRQPRIHAPRTKPT